MQEFIAVECKSRNNNGYISWELFEKCFCMRLPTYKFENLRYFNGYLDMECKWDLHKNIKFVIIYIKIFLCYKIVIKNI